MWLKLKFSLLIGLSAWISEAQSQSGHLILNDRLRTQSIVEGFMSDGVRDHLALKPWAIRDLPCSAADTGRSILADYRDLRFWLKPDNLKYKVSVKPILDLRGGYSTKADGIYAAYAGLAIFAELGEKWSIYTDFFGGSEELPEYISTFTETTGVLPAFGENLASQGSPAVFAPSARLDFAPSEFFQFELGFGRNFIGNGYRSLFLSDITYAYPYLKIETDFWHIKYTNLFTSLRGLGSNSSSATDFKSKYSSMHYLSWAATPRFNVGLFEAVVWQGQDLQSDRGFDVNYLNPVIFFRPAEFSIGSPDNSLIGLDLSVKATDAVLVYGQFLLDEFLLSAFRDGNGWWGNKWAAQIGASVTSPKGWQAFTEFNVARPFTYSHGSVLQNYAHYNQPLAHPLGANFYEALVGGQYTNGFYYGDFLLMWADYGRDPQAENLGGDIFKSYINPTKLFENTIGQGIRHDLIYSRAEFGVFLRKEVPIKAGIYAAYRSLGIAEQPRQSEFMVGVRISANIYNSYREF